MIAADGDRIIIPFSRDFQAEIRLRCVGRPDREYSVADCRWLWHRLSPHLPAWCVAPHPAVWCRSADRYFFCPGAGESFSVPSSRSPVNSEAGW